MIWGIAPSWPLAIEGGWLFSSCPRPGSNRPEVLGNRQYSCHQYIITTTIDIFAYIAYRIYIVYCLAYWICIKFRGQPPKLSYLSSDYLSAT